MSKRHVRKGSRKEHRWGSLSELWRERREEKGMQVARGKKGRILKKTAGKS